VTGSFLIGLIAFSVQGGKNIDPRMVLFLKVGICGGFTTFSTFSLETFGLLQKGSTVTAAVYIICSVLLGLAAVLAAKAVIGPLV
jgi:CrcB protein